MMVSAQSIPGWVENALPDDDVGTTALATIVSLSNPQRIYQVGLVHMTRGREAGTVRSKHYACRLVDSSDTIPTIVKVTSVSGGADEYTCARHTGKSKVM